MTKHTKNKYWSARLNRKSVPIKQESVVSVKAEQGREHTELLFIVDGIVYGCLVEETPEPETPDPAISPDKVCPYCKTPLRWEQFKELWVCREHGSFDDSQIESGV